MLVLPHWEHADTAVDTFERYGRFRAPFGFPNVGRSGLDLPERGSLARIPAFLVFRPFPFAFGRVFQSDSVKTGLRTARDKIGTHLFRKIRHSVPRVVFFDPQGRLSAERFGQFPIVDDLPESCGERFRPLRVEEQGRRFTYVSMGNPHAVAFVEDYDFDWRAEGAVVETGRSFPNRTNVEYVRVVSPTEAEMKVWERGCGETMACGTGACAVAVAGALEDRLAREPVTVHLPGGDLTIHWNDQGRVIMTGPTVEVCRGVYNYDR